MDLLIYTLLGLSYVVIFAFGYAFRAHLSAQRRHYHKQTV